MMKPLQKNITAFLIIALLAACSSADEQAPEEQQEQIVEPVNVNALGDTAVAALEGLPIDEFVTGREADMNWGTFQLTRFWKEDSMLVTDFQPDGNFLDRYGSLLKYSPDSSRAIDLDSYNIAISRSRSGQLIGRPQGPDTEVSLIDFKNRTKTRLIFVGPGNVIEDAAWLDNENLVLISSAENTAEPAPAASVWKFNLPAKTFQVYETTDSSMSAKLNGYWKQVRLKDVQIVQ